MRLDRPLVLACLALITTLLASSAPAVRAGQPAALQRTVVVELFTSQGCSSCPPADRLLTELATKGSKGIAVIPLSYHVDYWNYIGWTDPFSSAAWSERQQRYAAQFASHRVYTPQVVVDGRSECVGSQRREVADAIAKAAAREPLATVELATADEGARLAFSVTLDAAAPGAAEMMIAIFETELKTKVGSGENARRTLHNDNVVRRLIPVGELAPGQQVSAEQPLELDAGWRRDHLGATLFVQSPETLEIYGAAAVDL